MRVRTFAAAAATAVLLVAALTAPVAAQTEEGLSVTTPFPAVAVSPGQTVSFDIEVSAPGRVAVDLRVLELPEGWEAQLRGGGFIIDGVTTDPEDPPKVDLEVTVPPDARPGRHAIVLQGTSLGGTDVLELELRVTRLETGQVTLTTDFPHLQGPASSTYTFDLELSNDTPRETVFELQGVGPQGWQVTVTPSGETLASSVEVGAGSSSRLTVEVDPSDQAAAGAYPILVQATGGGQTVETELVVEIVGSYQMTLTTPDERLNADASAGDPTEVQLVVYNDGSAPLRDVTLDATTPSDWEVTFRPEAIAEIAPGEAARVVAVITPSEDAVAGDYIVTIGAEIAETSDEVDLRVTVRTSPLWGLVGGGLIVAALVGLGVLFRRYGRR